MQTTESNTLTFDLGKEKKSSITRRDDETPYIGKDILELLTTGMYVNPLVVYREYIQNSVDAIDEALDSKLIENIDDTAISIQINHKERKVLISDNGIGIPNKNFIKTMLSVGDSKKRNTDARGMRGVGRLSGLAYAQSIVFRSSSKNDKNVMEAKWNCKLMRKLLKEDNDLDLSKLLDQVVSFEKRKKTVEQPHFFEVEIQKPVRMKWDLLMNEEKIYEYLSQVAPVPFMPNFSFKEEIEMNLSKYLRKQYKYNIFLNTPNLNNGNESEEESYSSKQILKPYSDCFSLRQELQDSVQSVEFIELNGNDGETAAVGWLLHSSYMGAIPRSQNINGIRARVGNIMIGEDSIFSNSFTETRFSNWCIGELHIIDNRVKPNGRRDQFEENIHAENVHSQISIIANNIAARCRVNSYFRNTLKNIGIRLNKSNELIDIVKKNYLAKETNREYLSQVKLLISESKKYLGLLHNQLNNPLLTASLENDFNQTKRDLKKAENRISDINDRVENHLFSIKGVSKVKLNAYREVFDLIIENYSDKRNASLLIEKIIKKIESKNNLH